MTLDSKISATTALAAGLAAEAAQQELELMRRARHGDFAAFEALVERLQPRVYRLAWRILGRVQDAEDVVQQTFLSLIESIDTFREEAAVATWVLRIATNHALKVLRQQRSHPTVSLETADANEDSYATAPHPDFIAQWRDDPVALAQRAEVRQLLDAALTELAENYRVVFVLRDIEGLSIRETAELLGLSEANVKVRLLRARLAMRERLTRAVGDAATQVFPDHRHH